MGRARSRPEIFFLLSKRLKPQEIVKLGFAERTVYNYAGRWPNIKRNVKALMKKYKEMKNK